MQNNEEYEINLLELLDRFFRFTTGIVKSSINFFYSIKYWLIALIIVGASSGYLFYQFKKPTYQNELIVRSNSISSFEAVHQVSNWIYNTKLPNNIMAKLIFVKANHLLDVDNDGFWDNQQRDIDINSKDTILVTQRDPKYFVIHIHMLDTMYFREVKKDIFKQLLSKKIDNWNNVRIKNLKELSQRLQYELETLDSLKEKEYFEDRILSFGKGKSINENFLNSKRTLYHKKAIELLKLKQRTDSLIMIDASAFEIESDIVVNNKKLKSANYYMWLFTEVFLGIGLLFLVLFRVRKTHN